jgi:histidyl-tRNA synthetase
MFQPPRGTKDFLPDEMHKRNWVMDKIRNVFEVYGFEPLGTPAFENWDLLKIKSGEDAVNQIYYFKDKSDRELGLRFEWTASLARVIASHREIAKPFKRYAIGPCWRYERPSEARRREFWQMDIDIIGIKDPIADAEVLACAVDSLKRIGFEGFKIKLNDRRVLSSFIQLAGMDVEKILDIIRVIDKLNKIGRSGVVKELLRIIPSKEMSNNLLDFISLSGEPDDVLGQSKVLLKDIPEGVDACNDLLDIVKYTNAFGFSDYIDIDLSLARGLDYYTGAVYEIQALGYEEWGSIAGGGRYDEIIRLFGGDDTPACGVSLGIERLVPLLDIKGTFNNTRLGIDVYIAAVSSGVMKNVIQIAQKLRKEGVITALSYRSGNLGRQIKYADNKNIPYLIIVGEREINENSVTVRDMSSGKQTKVSIDEIVTYFKQILSDLTTISL